MQYAVVNMNLEKKRPSEWLPYSKGVAQELGLPKKLDRVDVFQEYTHSESNLWKLASARKKITSEHIDINGHVNTFWYLIFIFEVVNNFTDASKRGIADFAISFEGEAVPGQVLVISLLQKHPEDSKTICAKVTCDDNLNTICVLKFQDMPASLTANL
jgi:acyl-ACP thioesterase